MVNTTVWLQLGNQLIRQLKSLVVIECGIVQIQPLDFLLQFRLQLTDVDRRVLRKQGTAERCRKGEAAK